MIRRALGLALVAYGTVVVLVPESGIAVPVTGIGLGAAGATILAFGVWRFTLRRHRSVQTGDPGTPETPIEMPVPGDDVDERLRSVRVGRYSDRAVEGELRERVRRAVVDRLVTERGDDRETAHEAVATGEWTDDPVARELFSGSTRSSLRARDRLFGLLGRRRTFRERFEAAVGELEAIGGDGQ